MYFGTSHLLLSSELMYEQSGRANEDAKAMFFETREKELSI
jgi:hypothetical protein